MEQQHNYTEEQLKGMQRVNLEMATVFFDFCKENGLTAYFCGGGCIGAIRHKGFVPWDDDLDFFMPREDYESFLEKWDSYEPGKDLALSVQSQDYIDRNLFATLRHRKTTYIKPYQKDLDIVHGVQLDVIPLDGCPSGKIKRKMQLFWGLVYQIYINQEPPTSKGKLLELIGRVMLALAPGWKRRYKMAMLAERHMTKYPISECDYITELCVRFNYMVNEYPKEIFASAVYKEFEGEMLPVPVGYDEYLKMAFGNYMELPPEEAQVPSHDGICVDLEHPYTDYKGIYYPKERTGESA